jgi:hypothetical protein
MGKNEIERIADQILSDLDREESFPVTTHDWIAILQAVHQGCQCRIDAARELLKGTADRNAGGHGVASV